MDQPARLVFIGAPGSGKSTVVNSVVASWLDATRVSARASLLPGVVERETLTRSRPRAETSTMEARVREEFSDACVSPDGRRALAAVEAQADSFPDFVLPRLPTLASAEVRDAPRDADFHVRITATYADERELEALVSKARLAFGLSAGPARRARAARDREDDLEDDASSSSSRREKEKRRSKSSAKRRDENVNENENENASVAGVSKTNLSVFERARVASVLGCLATDNATLRAALVNRDRPYLPARFRDFLGSARAVDFRGPDFRSSLAAARLWLARVAGSSASRAGCLALKNPITIEVPLKRPVVLVDTPGLDEKRNRLADATLFDQDVRTKKTKNVVDVYVVVSDGAPGPNAALERAFRRNRTLERMVSDPRGPALALLWPLDRLGVREADAERYAAETLDAARAGADFFDRGGLAEDGVVSDSDASGEAQSPLRNAHQNRKKTTGSTRDGRGWMWHLSRARARAASGAEPLGPVVDGVATWHGEVLDSAFGGASALARFVEGLASAASSRRLGVRAGLADDHSTAPRDAKDATVGKRPFREEDERPRASLPSSAVPSAIASRPKKKGAGTGTRSNAGAPISGLLGGSTSGEKQNLGRTNPNHNGAHDKGKALTTPHLTRTNERSVIEPARPPDARVPPKKKTVRFAPEDVFFEKQNEKRVQPRETEKGTSSSLRPPSRKRRKPLLDISRNAHHEGV